LINGLKKLEYRGYDSAGVALYENGSLSVIKCKGRLAALEEKLGGTDVGGNREVVCRPELGTIVPFDDHAALVAALRDALSRTWDRDAILDRAAANQWDLRVRDLLDAFATLSPRPAAAAPARMAMENE
jgi:glycosyltransferase involved in cell wall biosynthesis